MGTTKDRGRYVKALLTSHFGAKTVGGNAPKVNAEKMHLHQTPTTLTATLK